MPTQTGTRQREKGGTWYVTKDLLNANQEDKRQFLMVGGTWSAPRVGPPAVETIPAGTQMFNTNAEAALALQKVMDTPHPELVEGGEPLPALPGYLEERLRVLASTLFDLGAGVAFTQGEVDWAYEGLRRAILRYGEEKAVEMQKRQEARDS